MASDIALLDLRMRRRALIGYALGMIVYALVIVALYPSFKNDASLNEITKNNSTFAALFGATGSLTTASGWLNANLYSNFVPLVALLLTIGYGASCIAGQSEDGTLGLIATLPLSRRQIAWQKLAALSVQAASISIVTAASVVAGRGFDLRIDIASLIGISAGVLLLGIDFGLLAMLIGAATGSRGSALGITSSLAAASYLVSSLAPVVHWMRPARFASLFFYAVGDGQLLHGLTVANAAVLTGTAVVLFLGLTVTLGRLDVP
jgi:ABC-2 type transport system permease protein